MTAQPCLPEDIIDVNRHKEYTLISTDLLESVLTDTRLNAQTTKLWQILFNKARYNPSLEIKISYSYLGKKLGKSTRTIARYIDSLQSSGYLVVKHNFDKNGSQRPSTISVRVPEFSIKHAKKRKDRPTKNSLDTNETLMQETENLMFKDCNRLPLLKQPPVDVTVKQEISESINVLCGTLESNLVESHTTQQFPEDVNILPESAFTIKMERSNCRNKNMNVPKIQEQETVKHAIIQDKNDRGGYDINVIQNNINLKEINKNNNNTVVPFFQNEEQKTKRTSLEEEINLLEKRLTEGTKQLNGIKDHGLLYQQIRKNSELEATLHLARIALERLDKEIKVTKSDAEATNTLASDYAFMTNKMGNRPLSQFTIKRLIRALVAYGYQGNALNCLINEIVFEIRFGSLINCNKTKTPLSIDNAVNISLKLVRENRWSTPVLLKKSAATDFYKT